MITAQRKGSASRSAPPAAWEICLLDSLAKRGSGHTPDKKHPEYWGGGIKWVSLRDSDRLDNIYIAETAETISRAGINNSSAVEHPPGTVVLSRDAGVGKSAITTDTMAVSQHFMAWQCGPRLDNHFLYYWLQYRKVEFERVAIGNTIKTIGLPYFRQLSLPLPPLVEQRAIAAALTDVDALIAALDQLIAKKRDLKTATMQQLLTGQRRLPGFTGAWTAVRLGERGNFSKGKGIRKDDVLGDGLPCIRYGEIYTHHDDVIRRFFSFISPDVARESVRLRRGDIVFAGSGETAEEIGKCVAFVDDVEAYVGSDTVVFNPAEDDSVFLAFLLNHLAPVVAQRTRMGQGDAVVHIGAKNLAALAFAAPPAAEQAAIAKVLLDMDTEIAALEARRDKTTLIKQGMMQELLTGRTRLVEAAP